MLTLDQHYKHRNRSANQEEVVRRFAERLFLTVLAVNMDLVSRHLSLLPMPTARRSDLMEARCYVLICLIVILSRHFIVRTPVTTI